MQDYTVGFDVGGTRLKSGAVSRNGELLKTSTMDSGYTMTPPQLIKAMLAELDAYKTELGSPAKAVGLGFSGAVDPATGVVMLPGKIKDLEGYPFVEELTSQSGIPCRADNDGRLSIIAESRYGIAKGVDWALTITIGTGVGSGVMLDGKILRDPHLQFGTQLSHMVQGADGGHPCLTNAYGTAEMRCSCLALALAVRSGLERGIPSILSDRYFESPRSIDFKSVVEAVEKGDKLCIQEFDIWVSNVGWLLVSAIHCYAPQKIILSGGAIHAADLFLDRLKKHVAKHIFRHPINEEVPIVVSELKDRACVLGCGAIAWDHADDIA